MKKMFDTCARLVTMMTQNDSQLDDEILNDGRGHIISPDQRPGGTKSLSIPLSTIILDANMCLVRGRSNSDSKTTKRFFAYYGMDNDLDGFIKAKQFVTKYAGDRGFEYCMVLNPIELLRLPYPHLYQFDDVDLSSSIVDFDRLDTLLSQISTSTKEDRQDVFRVFFADLTPDDMEALSEEDQNLFRHYFNIYHAPIKSIHNPDYVLANLICQLGLHGWIRTATHRGATKGDEVMLCNIYRLIRDRNITECTECNLEESLGKRKIIDLNRCSDK